MEFRLLRADEIECRVARCTAKGAQLLLYKDARCDQNILDETVGILNWQRHHTRDNANCIVSIWDESKKQWIEKEDTGTESNTEAEKGLASDSFKRACFNFGIGRELYTSPYIFFGKEALGDTFDGKKCYDRFKVVDITYTGRAIATVTILDTTSHKQLMFSNKIKAAPAQEQKPVTTQKITDIEIKALRGRCQSDGVPEQFLLGSCKVQNMSDISVRQHSWINAHWNEIVKNAKGAA